MLYKVHFLSQNQGQRPLHFSSNRHWFAVGISIPKDNNKSVSSSSSSTISRRANPFDDNPPSVNCFISSFDWRSFRHKTPILCLLISPWDQRPEDRIIREYVPSILCTSGASVQLQSTPFYDTPIHRQAIDCWVIKHPFDCGLYKL